MTAPKGPLAGVRVLDFTHGVAGPYCTMVLGDLGCEVIKIEKPERGDPTRYMNVSERFHNDIPRVGGDYFLSINRNKKSVGIDMKSKQGVQLCRELSAWADVAVQNFRPGVMQRLGLGFDTLTKINPRLIYANIAAYADGPLKDKPGMDVAVQARSGVMRITGQVESQDPVRPGASLADFGGGIYLTAALIAALYEREKSGKGQEVSVSLLDATMSMLINYSVAVMDGGAELGPMGSGHPQLVPYQAFPTKDGHIVISAGTNKIYRELCLALKRPELGDDERFQTNQKRVQNRGEIVVEISKITAQHTTSEWLERLEAAGVPCAPVNTIAQAFESLSNGSDGMRQTIEHPEIGAVQQLGIPFRFGRSPGELRLPPPLLAEHTHEVLEQVLGRSRQDIEKLRASGAVG
jgi:crotonobetainyl-CoA:carnitine CoA-transferase CaiB-like acyl-CoA transferase